MRKSRLRKRTEKQNKKTIILSSIGIIIVLYLLVRFGLGLLVNFSLFVSGQKSQNDIGNSVNGINFISVPLLNPLPSATNSAQIVVSGKSLKNYTISLYLNNKQIDETIADDKGNFDFSENLQNGDNQISAKAIYKDKQSEFSSSYTVNYNNSKPNLELSSPTDGQQFKKDQNTAIISGKTDNSVTITVNGFWAVVDDNNNFSYTLPLQNGDNQIKVVATNPAGNTTEKIIKVNYSQ